MGFSLEHCFDVVLDILEDTKTTDSEKVTLLAVFLAEQAKYAHECGLIN